MTQPPLLEHDPAARRAFDYYPTPAWMTRALIKRVRPFDVIEPCAGDGAIVRVLEAERCGPVLTNDLDTSRGTLWHLDATRRASWGQFMARKRPCRPVWGVTNVPFDVADTIVPLAVEHLPYFATILRLSWLEPTERRARFLREHPPSNLIVLPRHDFKGRGSTDSVTSAWFVWGCSSRGGRRIDVVTREERDELIAEASA